MAKKLAALPEVFLSTRDVSASISREVKAGIARKLGPKLYTRNMRDREAAIIARNLWPIVGLLMPGTVVSHRTAFENRAAPDGSVFLSGAYARLIKLPGITLRQIEGGGPVSGDTPYMGALFLASRPRTFLENLLPSRRSDRVSKTVGPEDVERRLAEMLRISGEDALNQLRDQARTVAPDLALEDQFRELDSLIGALMRSRPAVLFAPAARAYAAGEPYDPHRLPIFEALLAALRAASQPSRPDGAAAPPAFHNVAFSTPTSRITLKARISRSIRRSGSCSSTKCRRTDRPTRMTCSAPTGWRPAKSRCTGGQRTLTISSGC
jgi:hypothetical protein